MAITNEQIRDAITSGKYNEKELLGLARQYGVPTSRIDDVMGWGGGTASGHARRISGLNTHQDIFGAAQRGEITPYEGFNLAYGVGAPQAGDSFYKGVNRSLGDLFMPDLPGKNSGQSYAEGGLGFGGNAGIMSQLMGGYINPEDAFSNAFQVNRAFRGTGNNGEPEEWIPGQGWSSVNMGENGYAYPRVIGHDPDTGLPQYDLADQRFLGRMIGASGQKNILGLNVENYQTPQGTGTGTNTGTGTGTGTGKGNPRDYINDPSYDFRFKEGQRALESAASAQGDMFSGRTARELTRYGQDFASQEWQAEFARKFGLSQQGLQALQIMLGGLGGGGGSVGTGGGFGFSSIPFGGGTAQNVNLGALQAFASLMGGSANSIAGAGQALGTGIAGSGGAWGSTLSSLADIFQNYFNGQGGGGIGSLNGGFS